MVAPAAEGRAWCFITLRVIYRLTGEFHYQRAKNSSSVITGLNWICEPAASLCLLIKWDILDAWRDWQKNQFHFNAKWWIILKPSWSVRAHVHVWEGIRASWCTVSSVGIDWWMRRYDVDQQDMTNELFHQPFPVWDCMMEATQQVHIRYFFLCKGCCLKHPHQPKSRRLWPCFNSERLQTLNHSCSLEANASNDLSV